MEQSERIPCPFCREMILQGAVKCKECGSSLTGRWSTSQGKTWARNLPERKVLGVAACVAQNCRVSPTLVRLGFVLLTFVSLLGLFLYIALALVIPAEAGQRSAFEAMVDAIGAALDNFRNPPNGVSATASGSTASCCTPPECVCTPPPVPAAETQLSGQVNTTPPVC